MSDHLPSHLLHLSPPSSHPFPELESQSRANRVQRSMDVSQSKSARTTTEEDIHPARFVEDVKSLSTKQLEFVQTVCAAISKRPGVHDDAVNEMARLLNAQRQAENKIFNDLARVPIEAGDELKTATNT